MRKLLLLVLVLAGSFESLRRHYPDQVQRVGPSLGTLSARFSRAPLSKAIISRPGVLGNGLGAVDHEEEPSPELHPRRQGDDLVGDPAGGAAMKVLTV